MDLRNNQITVAELLNDPKSAAVLQKRFGKWMKHPVVRSAGTLTLEQVLELVKLYIPRKTLSDAVEELKRV